MGGLRQYRSQTNWLASVVLAGFVFLLPVQNANAAATWTRSTLFNPADVTRTYMDHAGTWNGSSEVTNSTGDGFRLTLSNTADGLPTVADDTAFDLAITVTIPSRFRLPVSPFAVAVTRSPLSCATIAGVTATTVSSTLVTLNLPANTNILPGCEYTFALGLTSQDVSPFIAAGNYPVRFNVTYNDIDNDPASQQSAVVTQNVEVRRGEVALLKTALTSVAGNGDTVNFTVSLLGSGQGGIFNVVLSDVLSSDLTGLIITAPPSPPGAPGPGANQYTFEYIGPGEQVNVTIQATVAVSAAATSCPNLRNDASVIERGGDTGAGFDTVPFDLQNPLLSYTAPNIAIPYGAVGTNVSVPIQNIGTGVARNISLAVANLAPFAVVVTSPNWSYAAGVFTFTGTLAASATTTLAFTVSTNTCPPPANASLQWVPNYRNACGTVFFPPLGFSNLTVNNAPALDITKVVSAGALNIGQAGNYVLQLTGNNVVALPDDGVADNQDFIVSDTLPVGITGSVINSLPPTTQLLVNGLPYILGSLIPDNATITWRGDRADLSPLPSLQIDFTAGGSGVCPVGQLIPNTATVNYSACSISNTSPNAGFILNDNPAGGAVVNFGVAGADFEAGAADTNGIADDQNREGEYIPFTAQYSFPAGFAGVWNGSSYTAELRSAEPGVPLVLTNNRNDVHVNITRISDGAVICNADLNPATDFTGGSGAAAMVITNLGALSVCALPASMADHTLTMTYAATSPEGALDGNGDPINAANIGNYLENTTLTVAGGPNSCLGTPTFEQAANVNIERALPDLTVNLNNGNPVEVCSVVPATLNVVGPGSNTADNILLQFNDVNFQFVNGTGSAGNEATDITYAGSLSSLGMAGSRNINDVLMTATPNTGNMNTDGSASFFVRLRDSSVSQILNAQLNYDSRHRSPDGAATDVDRDYNITVNAAPFEVLSGQLQMEFFPPDLILRDSTTYTFRAQIANVGTGAAVNAEYRITLPPGMRFESSSVAPVTAGPFNYTGQTIEWNLGNMTAGQVINIDMTVSINQTTCFQGVGENITSQNEWGCGSPIINTLTNPGIVLPNVDLQLIHDANTSFCELCNDGEIHLLVTNSGGVLLTNVVVSENLLASGLEYIPGSTTYFVDGVAMGAAPDNATLLRWTSAEIPELANLYSAFSTAPNTPQTVEIVYRVRRTVAAGEEGLISADRRIQATASFGLFCGPPPQNTTSALFEIPLRQPVPDVVKQGRNVDANQPDTAYTDTVYGGTNDDVIWRVRINNNSSQSLADLEDLFTADIITPIGAVPINFDINFICLDEATATAASGGSGGGCTAVSSAPGAQVDIAPPGVDVLAGSNKDLFFVGRILNNCRNNNNTANIVWGCEVQAPPGPISEPGTNNGIQPAFDPNDEAILSTEVDPNGLLISQTVTGRNVNQPLGSAGIVTIIITNNSGGTVRNITFTDTLPDGYAFDQSQIPIPITVTSPYGAYNGRVNTVTFLNDAAQDENNTVPQFSLTSVGNITDPFQDNVLRNGDVATITLRIVKVTGFDLVADPDVAVETAPATDPAFTTPLTHSVSVNFENTCSTVLGPRVASGNVVVSPEDLDININPSDVNKFYILSNPTDTQLLTVTLTNNGGHDALNHFVIVTVGAGLTLAAPGIPGGCVSIGPKVGTDQIPPAPVSPRQVWIPALPNGAAVYRCGGGATIAPGVTNSYAFTVQKNGAGTDLTFRADVIGEITLFNGSPLSYPTATVNGGPGYGNDYSLDSIRARIIGFNLSKTIISCNEQAPLVPGVQVANVQIGEDCTFRITADWFGFATPGFGQIGMGNISITDTIPSAQGYISNSTATSGAGVGNITFNSLVTAPVAVAPPNAITSAAWSFNTGTNNITDDISISANITTRVRNDLLNTSAAPNVHAAVRQDSAVASFQVDFDGVGPQPPVTFNSSSPSFPPLTFRRSRITIAEPLLTVTKTVCNESGGACGTVTNPFTNTVAADVTDDLTYRIQIANNSPVSGVARKPAFDVIVTDTVDSFSEIYDPANDGIDNDGDGPVLPAEEVGTGDGIRGGLPPPGGTRTIRFDSSTIAALALINPGVTVTLYYRVNAHDTASPGQVLANSVTVTYDSLFDETGAQSTPTAASGTAAGARTYSATANASVNLLVPTAPNDSKGIIQTSLTVLGGTALCIPDTGNTLCTGTGALPANIQNVSVGDEIRFRLQANLPDAQYNNLQISDVLPAGLDCIETPNVVFSGVWSSTAQPTFTCDANGVSWNFGNRTLSTGPLTNLTVEFIARVENIPGNVASVVRRNGGTGAGSTNALFTYNDMNGVLQTIRLGPADVRIAEPAIILSQAISSTTPDALDTLTVTVTLTNANTVSTTPAYGVRVMPDFTPVGTNLTYVSGSQAGITPPDSVDTSTANRPIFSWNNPIPANSSISFTYRIQVAAGVQPLEVLDYITQASWQSLPGQSTALNATGNIGANGLPTGLRNGALPNVSNAPNDYQTSLTNNTIVVPSVAVVKTDLGTAPVATEPTIGAVKQYQLNINFPEGVSNNVTLSDNLAALGESFIIENIVYTFTNIVTPANQAGFIAVPVTNSGVVSWNIGNVTTQTEDDTSATLIAPQIRISYDARIPNDATIVAADDMQNTASLNFTNALAPVTASAPAIIVAEPLLTVAFSPAPTNVTNPGLAPDAGDVMEYTLTVTNSGAATASTAYDVNIVTTLATTALQFDSVVTATINSSLVAVNAPSGVPGGPLVWGRTNTPTADNWDIPPGQSLVLIYRLRVADNVEPNLAINSSVVVDWTSLDAVSVNERTGVNCPTGTSPDIYCATVTDTRSVIDRNTIVKTITNDTWDDGGVLSTAVDAIARVGDTVTYRLAIAIQEGITRNITLQDVLPVGMTFVDVVSINGDTTASYAAPGAGAGSNFSYSSIPAANVPAAAATGTVNWNLGTITNNPLGDATTDTFVIEYRARITEDAGIPHVVSTTRNNTATLNYIDANNNPPVAAPRLTSVAGLTVRQPLMNVLTKTDRRGGAVVSGYAINNVTTEIMEYRVHACNAAGGSPAYALQFTDNLPMQHNEANITGPVNGLGQPDVYINSVLAVQGAANDYVYTAPVARDGNMVFVFNTPLNPGQCVDIDFNIGFYSDFGFSSWDNLATIDEYYSLPAPPSQQYVPVGPAIFNMHNNVPIYPPAKTLFSGATATIGEEIVYRITVPSTPMNGALFDVVLTDVLDPSLTYVSATDVSGNLIPVNDSATVLPNNVSLRIEQINAALQAVIEVRARVNNVAAAVAGTTFQNSVGYRYAGQDNGPDITSGTVSTATALTIVEPLITAATSNPGIAPDAGDVFTYTVTLSEVRPANAAAAFDAIVTSSLSEGFRYCAPPETGCIAPIVSGVGNTIAAPILVGTGAPGAAQSITWNTTNSDIDVPAAGTVTVQYSVVVVDSVLANQSLTNNVSVQWTGIDGASIYERNGTAAPVVNNYFTTAVPITILSPDNNVDAVKTRLTDTFDISNDDVRVGDLIRFQLDLNLQEGTHNNLLINDVLPRGVQFERVISVNGLTAAPYSAIPFTIPSVTSSVAGNPMTGASTLSINLGNVVNAGNNLADNNLRIIYLVRVLNNDAHPQVNNIPLTNSASYGYGTATVIATTTADTYTLNLLQPNLAVTKTSVQQFGDTIVEAGELVTYTVTITNSGTAPAYDTVLRDTIPAGMRLNGVTTLTINGVAATIVPTYNATSGVVEWNFDNGTADAYTIAANGGTLQIVYSVTVDASISASMTLTNQAQVQLYYSFDDEAVPTDGTVLGAREIYGPGNIASVALTTPATNPLAKANPPILQAAIGEPFTYTITIPATPQAVALHDVRILDDLNTSAAQLIFFSVTRVSVGGEVWTPVNTGSTTNLVIEDTVNGIDIPANQQAVIAVTVMLRNTAPNAAGLLFTNTASYTFNQIDDVASQQPGGGVTTGNMTVVEPTTLTMTKTGPAVIRYGTPETFTLDIQNIGTGPAWDLTIADIIPDLPLAGMCDVVPVITSAQVFLADGVTPVAAALVAGTDFIYSTVPSVNSCTLTITMQTAAARIASTHRLIITYQAALDLNSINGTPLTNIAGATQWFSANTAGAGATGEIRTYTRVLTDGTVGTLDFQDAYTVTVENPVLIVRKSVVNTTSTQDPGFNAEPGDTLRYRIYLQNTGPVALTNFSMTDDLDRMNVAPGLFVPNTLTMVTVPVGADISNNNAVGGIHGTGLVDIRNLNLGVAGSLTDALIIEFEITLKPVLESGLIASNQAQVTVVGFDVLNSDDPNVNGFDDPAIFGDEDPTQTLVGSIPAFLFEKVSTDMTGDPAILRQGDTLRYTLTAKNVGAENATNVLLRDQIPANTTYVANSTTLNGLAVADVLNVSPLQTGILINAPENTTLGVMRADQDLNNTASVATITFDVVVNADVINGTVISNQGFLSGTGVGSGPFPDQGSDDSSTAIKNDPTQDIVGNMPIVDAQKTVVLYTDGGTAGIVDPGDTLRYTIIIGNAGAIPATGVVLTDLLPANTSYVVDSLTVNNTVITGPVLPLIAGFDINSSDLPPATSGNGSLTPGQAAAITFDVTVNGGTASGTIISNQGNVTSNELPDELTDADGSDENGDQPTIIAVGSDQRLSIINEVFVVGGGVARAGGQLEYRVRIVNIGSVPVTNILINDNIDNPVAGQINYEPATALLDGSSIGAAFVAPTISADYDANYGELESGDAITLRFVVNINNVLPAGTTIANTAQVTWNAGANSAQDDVSIDVGGAPGVANLHGHAWHDSDFDNIADSVERNLVNWSVEVYLNNALLDRIPTDANGLFNVIGLAPSSLLGNEYELRFVAPGAGANTGSLGDTDSPFTDGPQRITQITVNDGSNTLDVNLPIDPNGVVYDAIVRTPVVGATLSLVNASSGFAVSTLCFNDPLQQNQISLADGYYKFDLNFSQPSCLDGADYLIAVAPPSTGFLLQTPSLIIPPQTSATTAGFDVPNCPGTVADQIPATVNNCEVQLSEFSPPSTVPVRTAGTNYYLRLTLDDGQIPGESQLFNNHIPLDPELSEAIAISKTAALVNVTRSQLVPYTITMTNRLNAPIPDLSLVDFYPAGFKYVQGSARYNDVPTEPLVNGLMLTWPDLEINTSETHTVRLLLVVGAGVNEGEYVNRAQAFNTRTGQPSSGQASATVRVVPDPTFDCSDIIGKVFNDKNLNGYADEGEPGLAGVHVTTAQGLQATTDEYGRYHFTCAVVPNPDRGTNFIVKLDERSLPSGYRVTSENPRTQRATRGKMLKYNFGAAIHHVIRLDIMDAVFKPETTDVRLQWQPRLDVLMTELVKEQSVLRISYLGENEDASLVNARLQAVKATIEKRWEDLNCCYRLMIETEVFWRKGGPVSKEPLE